MVYSVSCGLVAASQLVMECTLRLAGRAQADSAFPSGVCGECSPEILVLSPWGGLEFLFKFQSGSSCCADFPKDSAVLGSWSQGKPSSLSELSSSGVSVEDLSDPRVGKGWQLKPWGRFSDQCK